MQLSIEYNSYSVPRLSFVLFIRLDQTFDQTLHLARARKTFKRRREKRTADMVGSPSLNAAQDYAIMTINCGTSAVTLGLDICIYFSSQCYEHTSPNSDDMGSFTLVFSAGDGPHHTYECLISFSLTWTQMRFFHKGKPCVCVSRIS